MTDSFSVQLSCGRGSPLRLPNDPDNSAGISAIGISGGIFIRVRMPNVNPQAVAYTILYSAPINDFAIAMEVTKLRGEEYSDWFEEPTLRWYWAEQVSINGTHEERIGPVSATSLDPKVLLAKRLSGEIHKGFLASSLRESIDRVDFNKTAIDEERLIRAGETGSLQEVIESLQTSFDQNFAQYENRLTLLSDDMGSIVEEVNTYLATYNDAVNAAVQDYVLTEVGPNSAIATTQRNLEAIFESTDEFGNTGVDYAALQEQLSVAKIDRINSTIENAWMVQLQSQVSGQKPLIGGFGLVNDGTTVEAGFDVDRFWVGRRNSAGIYPFIIDSETNSISFNGQVNFSNITGDDKPEAGATRNVHRGEWNLYQTYSKGDIVTFNGNSWVSMQLHASNNTNKPPASSDETSGTWKLFSAKGDSTYIRYSANSNGSSFTATPQSNSLYIGVAVASSAPTSAADYTWSRYRGEDGTSGTNGRSTATIYRLGTNVTKPPNGVTFPPTHWSLSIPESTTTPVYSCVGRADSGGFWVWEEPIPDVSNLGLTVISGGNIYADNLAVNGARIQGTLDYNHIRTNGNKLTEIIPYTITSENPSLTARAKLNTAEITNDNPENNFGGQYVFGFKPVVLEAISNDYGDTGSITVSGTLGIVGGFSTVGIRNNSGYVEWRLQLNSGIYDANGELLQGRASGGIIYMDRFRLALSSSSSSKTPVSGDNVSPYDVEPVATGTNAGATFRKDVPFSITFECNNAPYVCVRLSCSPAFRASFVRLGIGTSDIILAKANKPHAGFIEARIRNLSIKGSRI